MDSGVATQEGFHAAYNRLIMGRSFVEYAPYYAQSRRRFEQTQKLLGTLGLPREARHLDIGGGQMALLSQAIHGFSPAVGDVVETAAKDVTELGVSFERINLMDDNLTSSQRYDVVTLCEVIEHLPIPPYITFGKLTSILRPGGWLVMTTPNGFRIRNILRMLANREVIDLYRYPVGDEVLGHQHEYTLRQMDWQLRTAGYRPAVLRTYVSGWRGASLGATMAHLLTKPFNAFPHLRDGLIIAAQAPKGKA